MPHKCTNCDRTFPDGSKEMLSGCPDCGGNKFRYLPGGDRSGEATEGSPADPPESPPSPDPAGGSVADAVRGATTTVRDWVDRRGEDPPEERTRGPGGDEEPGSPAGPGTAGSVEASGGDPEPVEASGEDAAQASARSSVVEPDDLPDRPTDGEDAGSDPAEWPSPGDDPGPGGRPSGDDPGPGGRPSGDDPETAPGPGEESPTGVRPGETEGTAPVDPAGSGTTDDAGAPGTVDASGSAVDDGHPKADAEGAPRADRPGPNAENPDLAELRQELDDQFESIKIVEPGQYELNLMELYDREEYIISLMEDGRYAIEVPETWRGDRD